MDMATYKKLYEETKDCRSCQNMSCRVETNEKPVENCLGYIYHKIQNCSNDYTLEDDRIYYANNSQGQNLIKKLIRE